MSRRELRQQDKRRGLTVLELLVTISIMAVLMSLILPAIESAREAARETACLQNLHHIGLALHGHHEVHSSFPSGWRRNTERTTAFGWATAILPYLDHQTLWSEIAFEAPVDADANEVARTRTPPVMLCPSDIADPVFMLFEEDEDEDGQLGFAAQENKELVELPSANYLGVFGTLDPDASPGQMGNGAFVEDRRYQMAAFTRGLSQTFVVGERTAKKLPSTWLGVVLEGEDAAGRVTGYCLQGPNRSSSDECEFDSRHPGHVNFLYGDGHVAKVHEQVDLRIYRAQATRY